MDEFWKSISYWAWGLMVPMMLYLKKRGDMRVDVLEAEMKKKADSADVKEKADRSELERQRNNIEKLFDDNNDIRRDMNGGFERMSTLIHNAQTQILGELAKKADR